MASLSDVYDGTARQGATIRRRRLYAGTALVLCGALLAVVALLVPTTELFAWVVPGRFGARKLAGVLGGLAVPVALVGVFTVLPSVRRVRAAAAIGASVCLLGIALFWYAYPEHWDGHGRDLTLVVSGVYTLGLFTAVWSLFTAVVSFKTRNDPGGALELTLPRRGETTATETDRSAGGLGGIGFFGDAPDGEVETQTNRRDGDASTATGDGGSAPSLGAGDASEPDAVLVEAPWQSPPSNPVDATDQYCGNCEFFEYVPSSSNMAPYCERHDELLDDMDACVAWSSNR